MSRLERWSRLKRNVPQEQGAPPVAESVDELAAKSEGSPDAMQETPEQSLSEQSLLEQSPSEPAPKPGSLDHTLPDPETLEAGSDFSAFMVPGVSGALRRRALKRLWATGNYNVRDGLDDYDADYNQLLKPMGSELASKLRRWTHKVEEVVDKSLDDAEPESPKELAADEQTNENPVALEDESSTSRASSGKIVENTSLDDQSDYLSGTKTKT
ncbi:DUF3306 domain-containing protein [Halomonas sp. QX-2]|jgi:hypothetical protein|uniref:DUF3306 domain-containing protein n=1 Tax=Vreelandella sedimenti TaxID=2729618 RepID=A0A7Z0N3T2_9GAMM|nr:MULTISPECIES: DUF3306 domain-containing protein [Halomonas]NYT71100.1 DUF3306 domain-containing protein [Halomonas sedimenti]|tara:strand:- start:68138 stop:68776 length:639 start_codon:yes stop_codon:yes gene_type:complete